MLELYHHGSSVCAARVRFVLAEKELEWRGRYLDILRGDQFTPAYMKLNPKAVVPTLVHSGVVITESTVICEYLDEVFPRPALKPASAVNRARMRLWTKAIDDEINLASSEISYAICHRHIIRRLPPADMKTFLDSRPPQPIASKWHERKVQLVDLGLEAPDIASRFLLFDSYLAKMEEALEYHPWLAGDTFSLADIGMAPYVNRLAMLGMSEMWTRERPRLTGWFDRITRRPTFLSSFRQWCPPDLTAAIIDHGHQSWPIVKQMLQRAA